jgi:hypothetical protein
VYKTHCVEQGWRELCCLLTASVTVPSSFT